MCTWQLWVVFFLFFHSPMTRSKGKWGVQPNFHSWSLDDPSYCRALCMHWKRCIPSSHPQCKAMNQQLMKEGKTKHNWLSSLPRITEQGQYLGPVEGIYKGKLSCTTEFLVTNWQKGILKKNLYRCTTNCSAQILVERFPKRQPPLSLPKTILLETTKPPPY